MAFVAGILLAVVLRAETPDRTGARLDEFVRAVAETGTFMGCVLVARGDAVLLNAGYGMADAASGLPNAPGTRFRIGSMSKSFTAAGVLRLHEEGRLSIDEPLSRYLPEYPGGDRITARHLLGHSSGIPDYVQLPGAFAAMAEPIDLDGLISLFSGESLEFAPGRGFRYSNSGYVLCAKLIEAISGLDCAVFLQNRVLEPAGMTSSGWGAPEPGRGTPLAVGYHYTGEGYERAPGWDPSRAAGAGALYATVEDLYSWGKAIATGSALSAPSLEAMLSPTAESGGRYSMGWYVGEFLGRRRIYHGGHIFGYRGQLCLYPEEGTTIVVLSNVDQADVERIAEGLSKILFGMAVSMPARKTSAPADPARFASYLGLYDTSEVFGPGATMRVTAEGDRLSYRSNTIYDSLALPMYIYAYPGGGDLFFDATSATRYRFIAAADGRPGWIEIKDGSDIARFPWIGP